MKKEITSKLLYALAMFMYGTTGCLFRFTSLPAGLLVLLRAVIGVIFLIIFMVITRKKPNIEAIKKNVWWLILSGLSIGLNWIFLFEAYNNTTVANASLINYLAPALFIVVSPLIFKEKLPIYKLIFVFIALLGVFLVSGFFKLDGDSSLKGIILSILASLGYLGILIFNKKQTNVPPIDKVIIELSSACIVMLPYALFTTNFSELVINLDTVLYVLVFGIILTGVAYILYLGPMEKMESIHISILSYVEPVASVLLSFIVLHEDLTIYSIIGGIMILGSTLLCEIIKDKKEKSEEINNECEE